MALRRANPIMTTPGMVKAPREFPLLRFTTGMGVECFVGLDWVEEVARVEALLLPVDVVVGVFTTAADEDEDGLLEAVELSTVEGMEDSVGVDSRLVLEAKFEPFSASREEVGSETSVDVCTLNSSLGFTESWERTHQTKPRKTKPLEKRMLYLYWRRED
ncbi:hypothetical protein K493DRAFT_372509 [Basidiobolus meristosporus CBS 931.73]|uniref:Uncharacterized protein n=1 Tax=Basidiobolus meristosporus CBS 931.73 TaxID=1314790 RepID=A0A1Y1YBA3_9FUNG|nr:hypothetical protein K493DRAFT_372509 [Basidiobolus meristosporus CBS 931.73]|eukprot:ORX95232.1 hypothetical protein K493DRAFT_372509 [Basidiobolus meristosporus CBS 931.73]